MGFLGNHHIQTTTINFAVVACKGCPRESWTRVKGGKGRIFSVVTTAVEKGAQSYLSSAWPKQRAQDFLDAGVC